MHVGGLTGRPTSAIINFPIFAVRVGRRFEGVPMRPCWDPSGGLFANGPKQMCFESYVDTMGEQSYILL